MFCVRCRGCRASFPITYRAVADTSTRSGVRIEEDHRLYDGHECQLRAWTKRYDDAALGRIRAAAVGRAARSYVEANFGWEAIVPRLEALYA